METKGERIKRLQRELAENSANSTGETPVVLDFQVNLYKTAGERIKARQSALIEKIPNPKVGYDAADDNNLGLAQYQAALSVDLAKISALGSMSERTALKQKLLPTYEPFVWQYLEQGHDYPNNVAVQVMIWLFDVANIEKALTLALYLMPHQKMPERFNRDIPTFVCDEIYDWANKQLNANQSASPFIDDVVAKLDGWDLSPPVASKVLVMAAKHHNREENFNTAFELLEKAKRINPEGYGAKTLLNQVKTKL